MIGSGHLMRCLTLAQRYRRDGHKVIFICRNLAGNMAAVIEKDDFELYMLPAVQQQDNLSGYANWLSVTQEQDAADTLAVMQGLGQVDRLIVDSYAIDITWERLLRPHAGDIFVIDDLANRCHDCDILLDQNFYLEKEFRYQGLVPKHCQLLLGPKYALLRDEFYHVREAMRTRDGQVHNILVFYGGVDATDETTKAIKSLLSLQETGELAAVQVAVVVGVGNNRKDNIAELCHRAGFSFLCQVSNMAELMAEADLMLGAGGSTTWERCYLQVPAIVTAVADNQFQVCEDCDAAGLIYYLGHWEEVSQEDICQAIREMSATSKMIAMKRKMSQLMG